MAGRGRQPGDGRGRNGGGRKAGTPNKATAERRTLINEFLTEKWSDFVDMYENADPDTKLKIYMELIPYTTPKMASVEYREEGKAKTFRDELDELSGEKTRE